MAEKTAKTKVWVYFANGRAYLRTANGMLRVPAGNRRKILARGITVNGVSFPWSCSYSFADDIIPLNACVSTENREVEYINEAPITFYRCSEEGPVYKRISKKCVREFVEGHAQLYRMITNAKELHTNALGYAYPLLQTGHLTVYGGESGDMSVEDFSMHEVFTMLKHARALFNEKKVSPYNQEWLKDVLIPALETYLAALNTTDTKAFERAEQEYSEAVELVNKTLEKHISEFDVSDDGKFGFDCGFITIGFTDPRLRRKAMYVKNHPMRKAMQIPYIHMPVYAQSLAVQCREFEKAKAIVKKELGVDIAILHSEMD